MLFAYLDESATPDEHFYFLGALLCTERQALAIESGFEDLIKQFRAKDPVMLTSFTVPKCSTGRRLGGELRRGTVSNSYPQRWAWLSLRSHISLSEG